MDGLTCENHLKKKKKYESMETHTKINEEEVKKKEAE